VFPVHERNGSWWEHHVQGEHGCDVDERRVRQHERLF
jgi:hypothetical protein